jgi:hypothetical protein
MMLLYETKMMNLSVRLSLIFSLMALATHLGAAGYYNTKFGFSDGPPRLIFSTAPQTLMSYLCSAVVTVKHIKGNNTAVNVTSNLTINLSASGGTTFYSDANCTDPITSVIIATGTNTGNFYVLGPSPGVETISADASGYLIASQNETYTANNFIWTGGGGNANWNTTANWSGGVAPGSSNNAIFTGSCVSNCSPLINTTINVQGIRLHSGYSGTITQAPGTTITVGTRGWAQLAGAFVGGDSNITFNGSYAVSGGTYTPTSALTEFNSHYAVTGNPTLNLASANYSFRSSSSFRSIQPGSALYANVTVGHTGCANHALTVNGSLNVQNFTASCGNLSTLNLLGGNINISGNLNISAVTSGSTQLNMIGSGTITQANASHRIGHLTINTGGTYNLVGSIDISGSYSLTSGTINAGTSTVKFSAPSSTTTQSINPGNANYNHVQIGSTIGCYNRSQEITGTLKTVDLTTYCIDNYSVDLTAGMIEVSGNLSSNARIFGFGTIKMVGTGTITGAANSTLPTFIIDSAGTLNLAGTIGFRNDFTYVAGTVIPGTSSVFFTSESNAVTQMITPGNVNFANVTIGSRDGCYQIKQIVSGILKTQTLNTFCADAYTFQLLSGTIEVSGDLNSNASSSGDGLIKLMGSGTITGLPNSSLPNVSLDTSGSYTLTGSIAIGGHYTYTSGTLNPGTAELKFTGNDKTIIPGNINYGNVTFTKTYCYTLKLTISGSMNVENLFLQCGDSSNGYVNTGDINVFGNLTVAATTNIIGSAGIIMTGPSSSSITQGASSRIPSGFTINKTPGATISLATNVSLMGPGQSLVVTSGNIDMAGRSLSIASSLSLNGNTLTKNSGVLTVNSVVAGTGPLYGGTVNP